MSSSDPPRKLKVFTTSRLGERSADLARLTRSLDAFRSSWQGEAECNLLLQLASAVDARTSFEGSSWRTRIASPCSLSAARNLLIAAQDGSADPNTVVAFPDDDAWYAPHTLAGIMHLFASTPELDFLVARYGSEPFWQADARARRPSLQEVLSNATSNAIFIRESLFAGLGAFDETLGLGTPVISGEDTDLALRAFRSARLTLFLPFPAVGHRPFDASDRARYWGGAFIAIARHAKHLKGGPRALTRKLGVGLWLVWRRQLPWRDLVRFLKLAAAEFAAG